MGTQLAIEECNPATELQGRIQDYQSRVIGTEVLQAQDAHRATQGDSSSPVHEGRERTRPDEHHRLLGDLPSIEAETARSDQIQKRERQKGKIKISSRAAIMNAPEDMLCAIDGKVMINPVRSPYGHLFERKTLEKWFLNCGSVCPVTSKP